MHRCDIFRLAHGFLAVVVASAVACEAIAGKCPFHMAEMTSHDREYQTLLEKEKSEQAHINKSVNELLKKVFFPFMERLHESTQDAVVTAEDTRGKYPIRQLPFHLRYAREPWMGNNSPGNIVYWLLHVDSNHPEFEQNLPSSVLEMRKQFPKRPWNGGSDEEEKNILNSISTFFGFSEMRSPVEYTLSGEFDAYLVSANLVDPYLPKFVSSVVTPVGHYGLPLAEALFKTTHYLCGVASKVLKDLSMQARQANNTLLAAETARGKDNGPDEESPLRTMLEGIVSLHQSLALMTAEAVPGAANGLEAVRRIIFEGDPKLGLVTDYVQRQPMGMVGPSVLKGIYLKGLLKENERSRLQIVDAAKAFLLKARGQYKEEVIVPVAGETHHGVGCPLGNCLNNRSDEQTGLQILAEIYWPIFIQVWNLQAKMF